MNQQCLPVRTMIWSTLLLCMLSFSILIPNNVDAEEPLRIVTIHLQPFGFLKEKTPTGLHYELSNRIAEKAGLQSSNRLVPYARVMKEFEEGTADMVVMYTNDALKEFAEQIVPVTSYANIILGPSGTEFGSIEDLHGKKVAQVRGSLMDVAFSKDRDIEKFPTNDYTQSLRMLFAGRVDAVIGSEVGLYSSLTALGYRREDAGVPLVLNTTDAWLHVSKRLGDEETISVLRQAVETLKEEGVIAEIRERYMFQE